MEFEGLIKNRLDFYRSLLDHLFVDTSISVSEDLLYKAVEASSIAALTNFSEARGLNLSDWYKRKGSERYKKGSTHIFPNERRFLLKNAISSDTVDFVRDNLNEFGVLDLAQIK